MFHFRLRFGRYLSSDRIEVVGDGSGMVRNEGCPDGGGLQSIHRQDPFTYKEGAGKTETHCVGWVGKVVSAIDVPIPVGFIGCGPVGPYAPCFNGPIF